MDKAQSTQFVKDIFNQVWENFDETKLAKFYNEDVVAIFGNQTARYSDIEKRLRFVKANYLKIYTQIEDVIVDGNKVAISGRQEYIAADATNNQSYIFNTIYELKNNKVARIASCINPEINYFQA